ncbi:MAG: extracellular solute-binding protein [Lachnospiraceae bacterium]|jgi:raffinose/stachyose/melibiose transport system substrate-binding protein|nr:extracellular solute-binding protein [Lachnospiraceae bacterium]
MSQTTSEETLATPLAGTTEEGGSNQPPANTEPKRGKRIAIAAIISAVLLGGILVALFLTKPVNVVTVLSVSGTVEVERPPETLAARKGMRLQNRDTVRTGSESSSWLALDKVKAVELAELTALRIEQGARGFALTLAAGEIKTEINKPLAEGEDFAIHTGNLVLAVRGTEFTVNYGDGLVAVTVESGLVAVLDAQGGEIAVLGAGESGVYDAAPPEPEPEPEEPADEQVTLRVLNYIDLSASGAAEELAFVWDAFEREHPDITIIREDEYDQSYHNKVETYVEAGSIPDVIYCWPAYRSTTLHTSKLLKDLTPLVERDGLDKLFNAAYLDPAAQAGGYLAMLPRGGTSTNTFWVNHEVLDAAGLTPAKTYSELKGQVRALRAAGYETVMMPNQSTWVMQSCLFSLLAGRFMGEGWEQKILGGETDFTDPQFVAALDFVKDMYASGVLAQSSLALDYGEAPGLFSTNKAAYYIDGDWRAGNFITDATTGEALIDPARQENFEIQVFPDIDAPWSVAFNRSSSVVLSTGWGMSAALADGSPEAEAAWTLVKWLSSKEVHEFLLNQGGISNSSRNDIDWSSLDLEPLQVKTASLGDYYDKITVVIDGSFESPVYQPLNEYLQALGLGFMTPAQVSSAIQGAFEDWKATQ